MYAIRSYYVQPDGKILVTGLINHHGSGNHGQNIGLARYNPDGSRITSYNVCYTKLLRTFSLHINNSLKNLLKDINYIVNENISFGCMIGYRSTVMLKALMCHLHRIVWGIIS